METARRTTAASDLLKKRREERAFDILRLAAFLLLRALLHVVIKVRIHVRCRRGVLVRALSGEVSLLLANSARVVRGQRAILGEVPELAASVALIVRLGLSRALGLRSRVRLRARARPVSLFAAAITHIVRTRTLALLRRSGVIVPSRAAALSAVRAMCPTRPQLWHVFGAPPAPPANAAMAGDGHARA